MNKCIAVIGGAGAGKSTTVKALTEYGAVSLQAEDGKPYDLVLAKPKRKDILIRAIKDQVPIIAYESYRVSCSSVELKEHNDICRTYGYDYIVISLYQSRETIKSRKHARNPREHKADEWAAVSRDKVMRNARLLRQQGVKVYFVDNEMRDLGETVEEIRRLAGI